VSVGRGSTFAVHTQIDMPTCYAVKASLFPSDLQLGLTGRGLALQRLYEMTREEKRTENASAYVVFGATGVPMSLGYVRPP